jgi:hypothetical protein
LIVPIEALKLAPKITSDKVTYHPKNAIITGKTGVSAGGHSGVFGAGCRAGVSAREVAKKWHMNGA